MVTTNATPVRREFKEVIRRAENARAPAEAVAMAVRVFERIERAEERSMGIPIISMKSGRMMLLQKWWGPAPHTSPFL